MTTIAYRDGVIASDSRSTMRSLIDTDDCKKLFELEDGSVIGMAGDWTAGLVLMERVQATGTGIDKLPRGKLKCTAILVKPDKHALMYEDGLWYDLDEWGYPYFAIGSGLGFALSAMDAGAGAEEAVEICIRRDIYSGGAVQSYHVFEV